MIWLGVLTFFLLVIWWRYRNTKGVPLLKANIASPDGLRYYVEYEQLHPDVTPVEHVRLILYFASKMLYNLAPLSSDEAVELLKCIEQLGDTELTQYSDVNAICNTPFHVCTVAGNSRTYSATLSYQSDRRRSIRTTLPLSPHQNQTLGSWLSVVQSSLPELDDDLLHLLSRSLFAMAGLYSNGNISPVSIKSMINVPVLAFDKAFLDNCIPNSAALTSL